MCHLPFTSPTTMRTCTDSFPVKRQQSTCFWQPGARPPWRVYVETVTSPPPPGVTSAPPGGFSDRKVIFCRAQAGSDVTGPSSSSGPGSSLAPEILRSFPVVLAAMEKGRGQQGGRCHQGRSIKSAPLPIQGNRGGFSEAPQLKDADPQQGKSIRGRINAK